MPRDIIGRLDAATVEVVASPAVQSQLAHLGLDIFPQDHQAPEALGEGRRREKKSWPVIKEFGIKPE